MRLISQKGKRARDLRRKSAAALLLSTCLLIPHLADVAIALQSDGLVCPAHPVHNSECGYVEGAAEQPCLHLTADAHDDNCYIETAHHHTEECYAEQEEASDGLQSPDGGGFDNGDGDSPGSGNGDSLDGGDGGILESAPLLLEGDGTEPDTDIPEAEGDAAKGAGPVSQAELICQLQEGETVRVLGCPHARGAHTEECGYAAAVEAVPCSHHCPQCPEDAGIQTLAEEDGVYHAATEQELIAAFKALDRALPIWRIVQRWGATRAPGRVCGRQCVMHCLFF